MEVIDVPRMRVAGSVETERLSSHVTAHKLLTAGLQGVDQLTQDDAGLWQMQEAYQGVVNGVMGIYENAGDDITGFSSFRDIAVNLIQIGMTVRDIDERRRQRGSSAGNLFEHVDEAHRILLTYLTILRDNPHVFVGEIVHHNGYYAGLRSRADSCAQQSGDTPITYYVSCAQSAERIRRRRGRTPRGLGRCSLSAPVLRSDVTLTHNM